MDTIPDSMPIVHGAHMGPIWVLSAPDGPHVGSMNLAIRDVWQCFVVYGICTLNCETRKWSIWDVYRHTMVDILDTIIAKIKSEGQRLLFFILHMLNDVTINSNKSTYGGYHGYVYWDETRALQTTRQIWGIWKLRPAYSLETPNLGQNGWCFVPCDLEIWWMTLENNRASLRCCFKLCATFHSHW